MNRGRTLGVSVLAVLCVIGALGRGLAVAQSAQLQGLIIGRSGASLTVQTPSSGNVVSGAHTGDCRCRKPAASFIFARSSWEWRHSCRGYLYNYKVHITRRIK